MINEYEVSDLALATTLACLGYRINALERSKSDSRRVNFFFALEQGLPEAVAAFWTGELKVSALHLFTHHKLLKQRIYATQK
ncbi:MAG: hypothetical protein PHX87_02585 [Candidatus Peribacteraceae bacterium]|nr:hypothetical protein [Candidatus Peribacteraceae bacterium]